MSTNVSKENGNTKVEISSFTEVIKCSNGLLNVRKHLKYGYVTKDGREITPLRYDSPSDFKDGLALVKRNRSYYWLDDNGVERPVT